MSTPGAANGSGAHATTAADLPYGGDVQAAAKAQDREAIRTIMAWRTAKERGEAPPAAAPAPAPPAAAPAAAPQAPAPAPPAPEPAEALAAAAAAAPTRRSLSDLVAEQDKRAPPPPAPAPAGPPPSILGAQAPAPSILGNNAADGWAASEPAPPATIDKLKATLAAEVAKADESTKMATEDAPQDGMAAHDKAAAAAVAAMAAGRAPPPPPPQVETRDASKETVDVTCKPCKSPLLEGVADDNTEADAAEAYAKAKAKGDAASEAANAANKAKKALEEKPKPLTGAAAKAAYRAAIEARQKAAQASQPKADKKKKEKKVRPQCHLRGRRDGVFMRPRRLDDAAVRESTRDGVGPRAGQEGQEGRQGAGRPRRGHPIHGYGPKTHPGHGASPVEPLERLLQGPPRHPEEGLRRGPVDRDARREVRDRRQEAGEVRRSFGISVGTV